MHSLRCFPPSHPQRVVLPSSIPCALTAVIMAYIRHLVRRRIREGDPRGVRHAV
jgi:hypothetical protein